jgi:hypothetical protein
MKRSLLSLLVLIGSGRLMAREIVDGYYLTLKNDTVLCKIEPRDQSYEKGGTVRSEHYMLEDTAKNVITVENGLLSGYKRQIREFLNGNSALLDLFDKHVSHIIDLPDFVRIANSIAGS